MKNKLPIDDYLTELRRAVRERKSLVLGAAPGAGKTTRLPPALLEETKGAVWVLEPRRIAAIAASQRIAEENGWTLGREVGYQVRFDQRYSRETRLLFLTEALLLRKLLSDPELRGVGCVVLDEFHERSLHVDLALGALRELRELARPDLQIVVMSATLDATPLAEFIGAPVVNVPGKLFPIDFRYEDKSQLLRTSPDFTERMQRLVIRAASEQAEGDILCFLPGRGEIERLREALSAWAEARGVAIFALHGSLELREQRAALEPIPRRRKIILATNVAESSLTVEGVRVVVDSGLARVAQLHPRTGYESLDLARISKASATQRAGRAGRLGPGTVYRAWTLHDERSMKDFEAPEVARTDLAEGLLLLSALGVTRPESFAWFEPPPARTLAHAQLFLRALGATDSNGALTPLGQSLREIPLHPRLAKLLLRGRERGMPKFAAELAALLSEASARPNAAGTGAENDLLVRWEGWRRSSPNHPRHQNLQRVARQLRELIGGEDRVAHPEAEMGALLLEAFGDRLCRRRRAHEPQAKMTGGRGVRLHPDTSVKSSEYFLALELVEGREVAETTVFQAVGLAEELVQRQVGPLARPAKSLEWDDESKRFWVTEAQEWNGLPIGRTHRRPATGEEASEQLPALAAARFDHVLAVNAELGAWWSRVRFLARANEKFPQPEAARVLEALTQASYGENSLENVMKKDLVPYFEQAISPEHRNALARECPPAWVVPSGSRITIQYTEEQGPLVEVRLQELFGLPAAPIVAGQPLTLALLAPNYRPVQVTRDLASFWRTGYHEVRKDLRARYPKHSWPEDPLTAPPQAKGRPRQT